MCRCQRDVVGVRAGFTPGLLQNVAVVKQPLENPACSSSECACVTYHVGVLQALTELKPGKEVSTVPPSPPAMRV